MQQNAGLYMKGLMMRRRGFFQKLLNNPFISLANSSTNLHYFLLLHRYATLEGNWDKHKPELSDQDNLDAFNSFTPGYPYRPDVDMDEFIPDTCPNKPKVRASETLLAIGRCCCCCCCDCGLSEKYRGFGPAVQLSGQIVSTSG